MGPGSTPLTDSDLWSSIDLGRIQRRHDIRLPVFPPRAVMTCVEGTGLSNPHGSGTERPHLNVYEGILKCHCQCQCQCRKETNCRLSVVVQKQAL